MVYAVLFNFMVKTVTLFSILRSRQLLYFQFDSQDSYFIFNLTVRTVTLFSV